jgi:membrane protein DedA with SNARE-associated domain
MVEAILAHLSTFVISVISSLGYPGILLLMAVESACIPLPSEVILPFSGYLIWTGRFHLWGVALAGALGCNLGSAVAYWAGAAGGRAFLLRYGRYLLISSHDIEIADRWFEKHGQWTVFVSRMLPVIRTFIAFPAGVARMNFWKFHVYTFLGSFPWCLGLAYAGMQLGAHWDSLRVYFHRFDTLIGVVLVAGAAAWVWRHWKHSREEIRVGGDGPL